MNSKFLMVSLLAVSSVVASDFEFANVEQAAASPEANPFSNFARKLFQGHKAFIEESAQISVQRAAVAREAAAQETARFRVIDEENALKASKSKEEPKKEEPKVVSSRFAMAKKAIIENPRTSVAVAAVCVIALSTAIYKIVQAKKVKKQAFLEKFEEEFEVVL